MNVDFLLETIEHVPIHASGRSRSFTACRMPVTRILNLDSPAIIIRILLRELPKASQYPAMATTSSLCRRTRGGDGVGAHMVTPWPQSFEVTVHSCPSEQASANLSSTHCVLPTNKTNIRAQRYMHNIGSLIIRVGFWGCIIIRLRGRSRPLRFAYFRNMLKIVCVCEQGPMPKPSK